MKVRVLREKWGSYTKGETLDIPIRTTALACIKTGAVEAVNAKDLKEEIEVITPVDESEKVAEQNNDSVADTSKEETVKTTETTVATAKPKTVATAKPKK